MHGLLYIIFNSSVYYLAVEPNEWKERIRNRKKIRAMNANFTLRKLKNNEDLYSLTFYQARGCLTSCHFNKYCVYLCNFFQKYYHCIHITWHEKIYISEILFHFLFLIHEPDILATFIFHLHIMTFISQFANSRNYKCPKIKW